jgi:tagatose 6-phosphate kinase
MAAAGIRVAVLSLGQDGALALAEGERYRVHAPRVEEINDLGGGDSMVAGLCWAAAAGCSVPESLAWAAACGAANAEVWDPGAIERGRVEQLKEQVRVEPL